MSLSSDKKSLNMLKTYLYGIFLGPAVKFVIFRAQRPLVSMALLRVRAKLTRTSLDSAGCSWLLGNKDVIS